MPKIRLYWNHYRETPLWNKVIVTGIYQQDEQDPIDVDTLEAFLKAQLPDVPMRHEELEDQVWERAWMDYYEPIQIGEKFWIVPEWLEPPEADAINISLTQALLLVQVIMQVLSYAYNG